MTKIILIYTCTCMSYGFYIYYQCSACNLIGQLPLSLDNEDHQRDHSQLNNIIHGHLLLQKSCLLPLLLKELVRTHISTLLPSIICFYICIGPFRRECGVCFDTVSVKCCAASHSFS